MIAGIHISQKVFAIDVLIALKSSFFEQRRKPHVLRLLRLYGDQFLSRGYACNISTRLSLLVPLAEHHLSSFKCCFLTIFLRQNLLRCLSRLLFLLRWNKYDAKNVWKLHSIQLLRWFNFNQSGSRKNNRKAFGGASIEPTIEQSTQNFFLMLQGLWNLKVSLVPEAMLQNIDQNKLFATCSEDLR